MSSVPIASAMVPAEESEAVHRRCTSNKRRSNGQRGVDTPSTGNRRRARSRERSEKELWARWRGCRSTSRSLHDQRAALVRATRWRSARRRGGTELGGTTELLLETQASIQRRCDIDHVDALEELVPWWGCAKSHSSGRVFPDWNHNARNIRPDGAPLKRFLNPRLLGGRALAERAIDWNDNHVLAVASQMCHLKGGHRAYWLRSSFSHVS